MENQLGAGLIEEVIQVADGELKLVDIMAEAKVYVAHLELMLVTSITNSLYLQLGAPRGEASRGSMDIF